jgi:hypothetical protein
MKLVRSKTVLSDLLEQIEECGYEAFQHMNRTEILEWLEDAYPQKKPGTRSLIAGALSNIIKTVKK